MGDEAGEGADKAEMVPSGRLREETKAKRAALARVGELEAAVVELERRGATVETLTTRIGELEGRLKTEQAEWASERAVYQSGITDPEAIDVARHLHQRLPEKDRPELAAWLGAMREDPTKAPKALAAYFAPSGQGAQQTQQTQQAATRTTATSAGATVGGALSVEQARARVSELTQAAVRSGDWSGYDKERPALLARISQG